MGTVSTLPAGGSSLDALGRSLDAARHGSVLAPATVICATPVLAVSLRRALGARPAGVAGVRFTTLGAFAVDIAEPTLAARGLRPARPAETVAAIRAELRAESGRFGVVATHRTTEDRLAAFHHELVGLPDDQLDRLEAAADGLSIDALRVVRRAADRLGPALSYDLTSSAALRPGAGQAIDPCSGDQVLELALARLDDPAPLPWGPTVLYLPEPVRPYEGRLAQALARRDDSTVLIGLTGHPVVDERHLRRLAAWSIQVADPDRTERVLEGSATVLEVPDPEEEVRAALREVAAHAAAGVPLTDLAVLHTATEPYANLLADQLDASDLPWCGPGFRRIGSSLAGRTLRRLLGLANRGLEREAVITLLASAPIDDGTGHEVPAALWDRLSRQAGVIDGDHWIPRLAELAGGAESDEAKQATVALATFVEELALALRPPDERTWAAWSTWALGLVDRFLLVGTPPPAGGPVVSVDPVELVAPTTPWPDAELQAAERLRRSLEGLADLDRLGLAPTLDTFEATVGAELAGEVIPGRPLGTGLYVGPLSSVPGLAFERIVVVGLAEGSFPRTPREDSLLPDQLRAAGGGMLIEKSAVTDVDVRLVGLAVAASRRPALLLTARGDLRSNRSRTWPRVLDALVGQRLTLDSHYEGLVGHGRPATIEDLGLRSLIEHVDNDNPVHTHQLAMIDDVLAGNLRRSDNRSRAELTAHAGGVPAGRFDPTERLLSPTALETYAACPRKYLFQRVLRLGEDERPERIDEITARDRGTLLHRILERFIADALADDDVPEPGRPWPSERRSHLFDLLDQEIKLAEARGITGGLVKTRILRQSLANELLDFLDLDDEQRATRRSTPYAAEFAFGQHGNPALEGSWAGRRMQLRGTVDRIDTTADGGLLVIDYKGGSKRPFEGMADNPLNDGRRLQLPLYARAVAERLGLDGPRTGIYWLTRESEILEMVLDDELEHQLEEAVGGALDGIGGGLFPGIPGEVVGWPRLSFEHCRYCDFDRICPTDRQSEWERVRSDPALEPIEQLLGGLDEVDDG